MPTSDATPVVDVEGEPERERHPNDGSPVHGKAHSDALPPYGVCLVVAYEGTEFAGSQIQPEQRTIQGELERAIGRLAGHAVRIRAAGRTDAGVHALGQIFAFDTARTIPMRGWQLGLDQLLPDDIRIQRAFACAPGYAPRFDSMGKHYRYVVQLGEAKNPLQRHRAWQLGRKHPLDYDAMRAASKKLLGTHDFRAFRSADDVRENTMRTLTAIDMHLGFAGDPSLLAFDVHGYAFMKNMVRILAGTFVDVGRGRIPLARVDALLGPAAQRRDAGITAPAHGLTLVEVALGRQALQAGAAGEASAKLP